MSDDAARELLRSKSFGEQGPGFMSCSLGDVGFLGLRVGEGLSKYFQVEC